MFPVFNFTTKDISISEHLWPFCWWIPLQLSPWTCSWMCCQESEQCMWTEAYNMVRTCHISLSYNMGRQPLQWHTSQSSIHTLQITCCIRMQVWFKIDRRLSKCFLWSNPLPVHMPITILLNSILLYHEWQHHFVHMCSML